MYLNKTFLGVLAKFQTISLANLFFFFCNVFIVKHHFVHKPFHQQFGRSVCTYNAVQQKPTEAENTSPQEGFCCIMSATGARQDAMASKKHASPVFRIAQATGKGKGGALPFFLPNALR